MPNRYAYICKEKPDGFSVKVYESSGSIWGSDPLVYEDIFLTKEEAIDYCKKHKYTIMNL